MSQASPSGEARPEHTYHCFEVLQAALDGVDPPAPQYDGDEAFPLFVTWNIRPRSGGEPHLRGCIGNFEALPLGEGLADYARISAFEDSRFDPITAREVPRLECGVSLLTDFEVCDHYLDWEVGTHGIYVEFLNPSLPTSVLPPPPTSGSSTPLSTATTTSSDSGGHPTPPAAKPTYRSLSALPKLSASVHVPRAQNPRNLRVVLHATFLPEVAPAQGWSKQDAVDAAMRKAGFKGVVTDEMRRRARVSRYQSRKVKATWEDWQRWRSS